ncbi:MAG: DUF4185 domain-containing protein [Cyanobacteria bacterium REEB67]|nr:DUF4185 domain-containing protein [Cyanobacteria bacterium REEB67]
MASCLEYKAMVSAATIAALTAFLVLEAQAQPGQLPVEKSQPEKMQTHAMSNPFRIIDVRSLPGFDKKFEQAQRFAGADAAYSIKLSPTKSLWLFGDTFVDVENAEGAANSSGDRREKDRKHCSMIRNSIAIDNPQKADSQPRFYLKRPGFFTPSSGNFYWPGDGLMLDGKLYLFMHETENAPKNPPPYQFSPLTDHLLVVQNPQAAPQTWQVKDIRLGNRASQIQIGTACLQEGDYLYIYCANCACGFGLNKNPTALARLRLTDLKVGIGEKAQSLESKMQWYSNGWQAKREFLSTLWEDGASEMSVTKLTGLKGFFAFYLPFGNKAIMMRHADRPEGPWSLPIAVYKLPARSRDIIYYSAKAHPEYLLKDGDLLLTYCDNSGNFNQVLKDRRLYFPRAFKIKIVPNSSQ